MFRILKYILLILVVLIAVSQSNVAKITYQPLSKKQLHELIPSSTRFAQSLSGKWQLSKGDDEWVSVNIPYCDPTNTEVQLRRTISIDKKMLENYSWHIYFLGIDDEVEVYLNEQFIGKYFGGMTSFTVRIPSKMLKSSTNTLLLKLLPASYGSRQAKEQSLFAKKVYTGAIREVILVGTPHLWISDINYNLKFSSNYMKCKVKVSARISSADISNIFDKISNNTTDYKEKKIRVSVEPIIKNKTNSEIVAQGSYKQVSLSKERSTIIDFNLTVLNPKMWSVFHPELYELTFRIFNNDVLIDEYSTDLGFVEVKTGISEGKSVLVVNGKILNVNGVDYIEDYYHTGASIDAKRLERDIKTIKTLGANLIRYKYNPPHPYFVKLCDKYGIHLMVELPIYDVPNSLLKSDEIKVRMKNIAERLLNSFNNSPSIMAWGITEGVQESSSEVNEFNTYILKSFSNKTHKLIYKTIPLYSDSIVDKGFDFINIRLTGMRDKLDRIKSELKNKSAIIKKKPVLFNFGMPVSPDNHNGYSDPKSVEAQANYIFNLYYMAKSFDFSGSVIWSYNDYELNNPLLLLNNSNPYICTSGLTDRYRHQRLSFSTIQSLFNNEKDPLFYAGSYSDETPVTFIIFGLLMCVVILLLINRFKRFREYLFRSILRPYNFYADIRDQRIISTLQTYILGAVISVTISIFFSSIFYFFRSNEIAQYIYMFLFPIASVQETFHDLIWMPELLILSITLITFILIFVVSAVIKLFSAFVRGKIFFRDTYTITIWAGTPLLLLLPPAIVLNRLLVFSPNIMIFVLIFCCLIFLWVFLRILKSIAVVFDIQAIRSYIIGFASIFVIFAVISSIYQYQLSIFSYGQYLVNVLLKM